MSAAQGRLSGALFILASATAFGVMPIFARYAYAAGADTSAMLLLRFGIAGLLMAETGRLCRKDDFSTLTPAAPRSATLGWHENGDGRRLPMLVTVIMRPQPARRM